VPTVVFEHDRAGQPAHPEGNDELSALGELVGPRRGDVPRADRDDDPVIAGVLWHTALGVGWHDVHPRVTWFEPFIG